MVETIFDTLNAKAACAAIARLGNERGRELPLILSATVNEGGALLTGQTVETFMETFWYARPLALGLNCSFGADKLLPHIRVLAEKAPCLVSVYPNAGLPGTDGKYGETPETMAAEMEHYFRDGLVNIAGGCCGTTPDHIAAIAEAAAKYRPRPPADAAAGQGAATGNAAAPEAAAGHTAAVPETAPYTEELRALLRAGDPDGAAELLGEQAGQELLIDAGDPDPVEKTAAVLAELAGLVSLFPGTSRKTLVLRTGRREIIEAVLKRTPGGALVSYSGGDLDPGELRRYLARYGAAPR